MASRCSLIFLLAIVFAGCRPATPPPSPSDQTEVAPATEIGATASPATPASLPDQAQELREAQYQLGAPDGAHVVQFVEGKYEEGSPGDADYMSITLTGLAAAGDLDGDNRDEVAALVAENYGGTGVFVFLAVYSDENGVLTFQTSRIVDDRPQLNALSISDGEIFLDAVIHGTDDPMCCPTVRTTRHYRLVDGLLEMTDYTTFTPDGRPRTITIETPSDGTEIFTSLPLTGTVAIAPFENNLTYRIYDVSGIELAVGPIAVTAPDAGAPGTFEAVIPLGKALSDTVIRLEVQDLSAADGSLLAMDSVELVVK